MLNFYFLRHGETIFNTKEIVQGWNDSALTDVGVNQARYCGYGLKEIEFIGAYSGDTKRQIDTGNYFMQENNHPVAVIPTYHFREMCYGKYEGGTYEKMLNPLFEINGDKYHGYEGLYKYYNDIEIVDILIKSDETGRFEGKDKTYRRLNEGLSRIIQKYRKGNILISTSSFAICTLIYHLFPEFNNNHLVENASITIIGYDGKYHLLDYNNVNYRKIGEEYYKKEID